MKMIYALSFGVLVCATAPLAQAQSNCSQADIAIATDRLQDYLDDRATPAVTFQTDKYTKITSCSRSGQTITARGAYQFRGRLKGETFEISGAMVLRPSGDVEDFALTGSNLALLNVAQQKAFKLYEVLKILWDRAH